MRQSNPFHSSRQGQLGSNWNCSETLKLPKIALKEPLLFLSAHSCHGDGDCYDDDNGNDENDDDWKVEQAGEQRKKICINALSHPMLSLSILMMTTHDIRINSDDI